MLSESTDDKINSKNARPKARRLLIVLISSTHGERLEYDNERPRTGSGAWFERGTAVAANDADLLRSSDQWITSKGRSFVTCVLCDRNVDEF